MFPGSNSLVVMSARTEAVTKLIVDLLMGCNGVEHICPLRAGAWSTVVVANSDPCRVCFCGLNVVFFEWLFCLSLLKYFMIDCFWMCISFLFVSIKSTFCLQKPFRVWPLATGLFWGSPDYSVRWRCSFPVSLWLPTWASQSSSSFIESLIGCFVISLCLLPSSAFTRPRCYWGDH